jgi:hypothetical protein
MQLFLSQAVQSADSAKCQFGYKGLLFLVLFMLLVNYFYTKNNMLIFSSLGEVVSGLPLETDKLRTISTQLVRRGFRRRAQVAHVGCRTAHLKSEATKTICSPVPMVRGCGIAPYA